MTTPDRKIVVKEGDMLHGSNKCKRCGSTNLKSYNNMEPYDSKILNFVIKKVSPRRDLVLGTKCSDCGNIEIIAMGMGL